MNFYALVPELHKESKLIPLYKKLMCRNKIVKRALKISDSVNKKLFDLWESYPEKLDGKQLLKAVSEVYCETNFLNEAFCYDDDKDDLSKRCVNTTYKDTSGTTVRTILMGMKNGKELSANSVPPGGDSANFAELVVRIMATRPSIVFLFDLEFAFCQICGGSQINIQWGYRFYSSSKYQLTNKAHFVELTTRTVEEFEEALHVSFEQNNVFVEGATLNQMTGASVLSRTLQDIFSDYEWKTTSNALTPTRKRKRTGKQLDQSLQNLVFIFTEVPTDETISSFCRFSVQDELSVKSVTDAILPKELAKRFQEFQLSLNFIDLSNDKKTIFSKIAGNLRGAVINALSFTSPLDEETQHLRRAAAVFQLKDDFKGKRPLALLG
ncbi:hypothetical protein DAPPUDRAFT_341718, partial [Daphnia pulex]